MLANPGDPEHEEMRDWLDLDEDDDWDPNLFNLQEADDLLVRYFSLD